MSSKPFQVVLHEVTLAKTGMKFELTEHQIGAFAGFMITHGEQVRALILAIVVLPILLFERLQQIAAAVIEVDFLDLIVLAVDPGDLGAIAESCVRRWKEGGVSW